MERWVCTRRTVIADPAALRRRLTTEITGLLQAATGSAVGRPAGDGSFTLTMRSPGGRLSKQVRATVGQVHESGPWLRIPLRWTPTGVGGPLFPSFEGAVELEQQDAHRSTVAVVGTYRPPASVVGTVVDAVALSRVAEETIDGMTRALAEALTPAGAEAAAESAPAAEGASVPLVVADVMTPNPLSLAEDTSLRTAANLLLLGRISGNPVVDESGDVVGVLSESDLLDKIAPYRPGLGRAATDSWRRHDAVTVGEACTRPARTTSVTTTVRDAASEMARHRVGRLVVMRGAEVAGIITRRDAIRALVRAEDAIEEAVTAELAYRGHPDVGVDVQGGIVSLHGTVELLSTVHELNRAISALDGVLDVHVDGLSYETDDLAQRYLPL